MPARYYAVRETDSYADATLHADRDCPDGPVRAAPAGVDGTDCAACIDADDEDGTEDADDELTGTCEVVKSDGEVCGRDRPCRYHD